MAREQPEKLLRIVRASRIQSLLFHQAAIGFFFEVGFVELRVISPASVSLHGHEVVSRQERFHFHDGLPHLVVSVLAFKLHS